MGVRRLLGVVGIGSRFRNGRETWGFWDGAH